MTEYTKAEPKSIQAMFGHIAKEYDRTNAILSFQLHRLWNKELVKIVGMKKASHFADLCSGTGEIALTYLKRFPRPKKTYFIDFCPEMLKCAEEKAEQKKIPVDFLQFIKADVQELPLPSEIIEAASMAYGIRNVQNPSKCFTEVFRVLKPGGIFAVLELTQPKNQLLKWLHKAYLTTCLPLIGKWAAKDEKAYRYLCNSIQNFSKPDELKAMMEKAGYDDVRVKPLHGGVATIIYGYKPALS